MKLALADGFYQTRAVAAAAQNCVNWYPESIESASGSGKSAKYLRPAPGMAIDITLDAHSGNTRGLFGCDSYTGVSRLFAVVGSWLYEVNSAWAIISSWDMGLNNGGIVQLFGNGNQLGIVNSGQFFISNGGAPVKARFRLDGTVAVAGTAVTWVAGDKFPVYVPGTADPLPTAAFINDVPMVITFTSATTATLAVALAGGTGTVTLYGDSGDVFWSSGNMFSPSWVGLPIVIGTDTFTITNVINSGRLQIAERPGGITYGLTYTVTIGNNTYSTAGGDLVTAVTGTYMDGTFYVQRPKSGSLSVIYTDLVIDATFNTVVTSAGNPFTSANVAEIITITGGTGFILGTYTVYSVTSGRATLSAVVGTVGSTGGTGTGIATDLGRQVNFSAIDDGTDWGGLDFFTKEAYPDYLASILADRGQIYLFGEESSEVWQNDLNTGRPVRVNGAVAREGSVATFAPVSMGQHLYFLGGQPGGRTVAFRVDGYTPTRISTHAIEEQWAINESLYGTVANAVGWWYLEDGHYFWVVGTVNWPTAFVYDATEREWTERDDKSRGPGSYTFLTHAFLPNFGSQAVHIVGDIAAKTLLTMSSTLYSMMGSDVTYVRSMPYIYAGSGNRVYCQRLNLDMATGLVPSGPAPTIGLSWSNDNGATFSTPEQVGFGTAGQTNVRVFWIAQGSSETSMIPRISYTGQAQVTLIDCDAEVYQGTT